MLFGELYKNIEREALPAYRIAKTAIVLGAQRTYINLIVG